MAGRPELADRAMRRRKREERALAIPVLGVALLASPLLDLFAGPAEVFGVPLAHVWVFGSWAGLILLCRAAARRLGDR